MDYTVADVFIGNKFKELRINKGLTIEGFANRIPISKVTYYFYETGKRSMPFDIFKKGCRILGVNYVTLFEDAQKELLKSIKKAK